MMQDITLEELNEATKAVADLLREKGHPHLMVIITQQGVKVVEDKLGLPFDCVD